MSENGDSVVTQSNLERAIETGSEDAINSLHRAELVYYLCNVLGTDYPTDEDGNVVHPSEHTGSVSRGMLRDWAAAVVGDGGD